MQSVLTIDLSAIQHNWRVFDKLGGGVNTSAVVKANAYGLGAGEVAGALAAAGARDFFVAQAEEAIPVSKGLASATLGRESKIYLLGGLFEADIALIKTHNIIPILNTPEQIGLHQSQLADHPFALHLDTGMNRLGIAPQDWGQVRSAASNACLIMSHLSCAEQSDSAMNETQRSLFVELTEGLNVPRSLSASYGITLGAGYHFDMTRPGVGLYGSAVTPDIKPVLNLSLPVLQVRQLAPDSPVGYDGTWRAKKPSTVATINGGYADGLFYALAKGEEGAINLYAEDTPCPLIGRVSMDLISVDITHLKTAPTHLTLLNHRQGIDRLAGVAKTIPYEVLCALSPRYQRRYING